MNFFVRYFIFGSILFPAFLANVVFVYLLTFKQPSIIKNNNILLEFQYLDKIIHFLMFLILTYLFYKAFYTQWIFLWFKRNVLLITLIIMSINAIGTEIWQSFLDYRKADSLDVLSNFIGILVGILISRFINT